MISVGVGCHTNSSSQLTSTMNFWEFYAKFLHCMRTASVLRTQRLGYSPKNTSHLSSSTAKQQCPHENSETAFNLSTLNMSFFHKVQSGQTQNPCCLTPVQCFVQWQKKNHMPTLHEHALLPQIQLGSAAKESPPGHTTKRGLDNWPGFLNSTRRLKAENNASSMLPGAHPTPMQGRK